MKKTTAGHKSFILRERSYISIARFSNQIKHHCRAAFNICFFLLCKMLSLFAESFRTDLIFLLVLFSVQISFQSNSTCLRLGSVLCSASVPFLVCKTYGLIGYMRLVVQEHTGKLLLAAVFFFKSFLQSWHSTVGMSNPISSLFVNSELGRNIAYLCINISQVTQYI